MRDYTRQNKCISLPDGRMKMEADLTEQERWDVEKWRASFGKPLGKPKTAKPCIGDFEIKKQTTEYLWCNTCKNGDTLNRCSIEGNTFLKDYSREEFNILNSWQIQNDKRTASSIKSSCPFHKSGILKNCRNCGNSLFEESASIHCEYGSYYRREVNEWIHRNWCYSLEKVKETADNCPGWEEKK